MYTNRNNLANYLQITISGTGLESHIDNVYIPTVEKIVNNYCHQPNGFEAVDVTEEKRRGMVTSDGELLVIPLNKPVNSISAITFGKGTVYNNLTLLDGNGNTRYDITHYGHIIIPNQELTLTGSFTINSWFDLSRRPFFTKLSYNAGFEELPEAIVHASTLLLASMYRKGDAEIGNKAGLRSQSQGQISYDYLVDKEGKDELVKQALEILNEYVNVEG